MILGKSFDRGSPMSAGDDHFHFRVELSNGSYMHKVYSDMCTARYGD